MKEKVFIAIAGNIGSGKSTLSNLLSNIFGLTKYEEIADDNPYLPLFYSDMNKWAYDMERYCLLNSAITHEKITMMSESAIQDRSVYEHVYIFAKNQINLNNITPDKVQRYWDLWNMVRKDLKAPDLVIYLKTSVQELRNRIKKRGRVAEKELTTDNDPYMPLLQKLYDEWFESYDLGPKLVITTDHLNVVDNPEHLQKMIRIIKDALKEHSLPLTKFIGENLPL